MHRRFIWIGGASLSLLLLFGVTTRTMLKRSRPAKVTVSFVDAEPSQGEFPTFMESDRFAFAARNSGSETAFVYLTGIQDEHGNWIPSLRKLGDLGAGQSDQFYLYLPLGTHPRSVRMRVNVPASAVQKAQFALRMLVEKAKGRYPGQQVWFDRLDASADEFVVSLGSGAGEDNATNVGVRRTIQPQGWVAPAR